MAIHYVDSAAAGANDGTSWTDAFTSITSADGAGTAAGDTVLIDDGHSETGTIGTLNFSGGTTANPIKIISVDKADDSLSPGATVINNSGALLISGNIVVRGVTFRQTANSAFSTNGSAARQTQYWLGCTLDHQTGSSNALDLAPVAGGYSIFEDSTITMASAGNNGVAIQVNGGGAIVHIHGGTIAARSADTQGTMFSSIGAGALIEIEGAAFQNTVTNICTITLSGVLKIKRCQMDTFTNLVSATPTAPEQAAYAQIEGSVAGTISAPALGLTWREDRTGTTKSTLARYRTGGADDGEQANAYSWEMVSNAGALEQVSWLETPVLPMRWVDAGDGQTVTVYVASGVTLQDDEFWIEVVSPSETDSPSTTSQARFQSTRLAFQSTPANLTTDAVSTWNGTGVTTKQKITVTINPAVAGPVIVRACLAKPSTTVYVDPKLEIA